MKNREDPLISKSLLIEEEAILLDNPIKPGKERNSVVEALRISLKERNLNFGIDPITNLHNERKNLVINNFSIKIITAGVYADEIEINLSSFEYDQNPPHLILLALIDDEYDYIFFKGVLTADEFKKLISRKFQKDDRYSLKIDLFKGGINRFYTFIQVLNPKNISVLKKKNSNNLFNIVRSKFTVAAAALVAGVTVLIGDNSAPIINLALITNQELTLFSTLRSNQIQNNDKVCIISPNLIESNDGLVNIIESDDELVNTSVTSVNKPVIYLSNKIKKISILKNGQIQWESENIDGPLNWPLKKIEKDEDYLVKINFQNKSRGIESRIKFIPSKEEFIDIDEFTNNLKSNKKKWIKTINKNIETNKDLAIALLFSNKSPDLINLDKSKKQLISKNCE